MDITRILADVDWMAQLFDWLFVKICQISGVGSEPQYKFSFLVILVEKSIYLNSTYRKSRRHHRAVPRSLSVSRYHA